MQSTRRIRVIIAGFGRTGAVGGRFLRANGLRPMILDINSEKVEVLRKVGIKVFYGDACRLDLLQAAGADKARLLILAIDSVEKTHLIAEMDRRHFPNLRIMATVATRRDAYEILDTGVEDVYREAWIPLCDSASTPCEPWVSDRARPCALLTGSAATSWKPSRSSMICATTRRST